ncbi:hypothetical protein CR513_48160, partial [Mucuna pruriens]
MMQNHHQLINYTLPTSTFAWATPATSSLWTVTRPLHMAHIQISLYIFTSNPINTCLQNHPTRKTEYYSIFHFHPFQH